MPEQTRWIALAAVVSMVASASVCARVPSAQMDSVMMDDFAHAWLDAWNAHDLELILSHYTQDVEFSSPFVIERGVDPSGTVVGKQALAAYWGPALGPDSTLRFELVSVFAGVSSMAVLYRAQVGDTDRQAVEVFHFNDEGKVYRSYAHYADGSAP